jgi:hypothetical protein
MAICKRCRNKKVCESRLDEVRALQESLCEILEEPSFDPNWRLPEEPEESELERLARMEEEKNYG